MLEVHKGTSVAKEVCDELGMYRNPQMRWVKVMQAACIATGLATARTFARAKSEEAGWSTVRPLVSQELFVRMAAMKPAAIRSSVWSETRALLGTIDLGEIIRSAPKPVGLLASWLNALVVVREMSAFVKKRAAAPATSLAAAGASV